MGKSSRVLVAACIVAAAVGYGPQAIANGDGGHHGRHCDMSRRQTERLVRRLFDEREAADVDAIWDMFADGGTVTFPFTGDASVAPTVYRKPQDETLFKTQIGFVLGDLADFQLTDLVFQPLKENGATMVTNNGTATVRHNGNALDTRFITEVHTRCGLFTSYAEYYDTSVFQTAFTP